MPTKPTQKSEVKALLRKIKYDLITERPDAKENQDGLNKDEYTKLSTFLLAEARRAMKLKAHEPLLKLSALYVPTIRLRARTFILENCPEYAKRLKKPAGQPAAKPTPTDSKSGDQTKLRKLFAIKVDHVSELKVVFERLRHETGRRYKPLHHDGVSDPFKFAWDIHGGPEDKCGILVDDDKFTMQILNMDFITGVWPKIKVFHVNKIGF